jgi:hypothetical protein
MELLPLHENILQGLPPNLIIVFLEIYKQLIYSFIILTSSQVFDKCGIYYQYSTGYVQFHVNDLTHFLCIWG